MGASTSLQEGSQSCVPSPSKLQPFSRLTQAYTVSESDLTSKEKKKKASKFATLRKKLIRVRRHSRSCDYGKSLRDLISSWSVHELSALVHEYEALVAAKELATATNVARPPAQTFQQDLSHLYDFTICTDVDLVYRGTRFPAHRALLSIRSPFFRELLYRHTEPRAQVHVKLRTSNVELVLFSSLLRFLYSGSVNTDELPAGSQEILIKVANELGMPKALAVDLRTLLDTGDYSDAVLSFSCEPDLNDSLSSEAGSSEALNRTVKHELPCHKAILAARSPFFRNLLIRRARSEEFMDQTYQTPTRIILDESVIPRRYARVLMHAIYLDTVDLSLIMRGSASMCSLSEVQAIVAGKGQMTLVDEAMEVYQIGQFVDFPSLSQGCEDIIVDSLTVDNLLSVLAWSAEAHGSKWVLRQALHFLREEFTQIAASPVLYELTKGHLVEALSSDFLQAGELDILSAVMKWGEYQLVKRIEKREPNLLSHTAHSVSRKGVKRRDLNDVELRDILAELLPLVRMDHVIPYNNETLISTIKRGLVSTPPSHMIGDEGTSHRVSAWVRGKNNGIFLRPRLFTPFHEEAKSILEDHISQGQDHEPARVRTIQMSSIPDTLYMVEDHQYLHHMSYTPTPSNTVDIVSGMIPVPSAASLHMMLQREQELLASPQVRHTLGLPCTDHRAIVCQVQLRVVREFGLPDSTVEILQNSQYYYGKDLIPVYVERNYTAPPARRGPSPPLMRQLRRRSPTKPMQLVSPLSSPTKSYANKVPSVESPSGSPHSDHDNSRSATLSSTRSTLSDTIPDIAMATANLSQVHVHEEIELDIGDEGANRHGTMYI